MRGFRNKPLAYVLSLLVAWAALWMPTSVYGQVMPGSPFQGGSGGSAFDVGAIHTFTATQTFNASQIMGNDFTIFGNSVNTAFNGIMLNSTTQAPDTGMLFTGSQSLSWIVAGTVDSGFNRAIPLQVNPTVFTVPSADDTTQRMGDAYYGSQGRAIKALTESTNTSAVRIPVAAGAGVGGTITFTAFASDATDHQTLAGVLQYAAVNKAATETCATPTITGTALNSVSVGTLTCTYACDVTPANAVDIQFNCVSSLTQTTLDLYWRLDALGASEPLPQ